MVKHLISAKQFSSREAIEDFFVLAEEFEKLDKVGKLSQPFKNKVVACLFYEPSTRTRLSFETAVLKLGGSIISSENAKEFSSAAKGETIEDTARVIGNYAQALVIRHYEKDMSERAAKVSPVPVINAGDGAGEHPSQALLDLYTIKKELDQIGGLNIALVGDLLYGRTIHSLLHLLPLYKNLNITLISPEQLRIPQEIKQELANKKVVFTEQEDIDSILSKADVLYVTRVQKERFASELEYKKLAQCYRIDKNSLKKIKKRAVIMHPLPRITEISPKVDADPRAAYFRQVRNGLYLRMAILQKLICE